MSVIQELEETTRRVASVAGGAVVRVGRHGGRGTGAVIGSGSVLTSAHNLRGADVTVTFADGRSEVGHAGGVDVDGDIAVVSVDTGAAQPIAWGPEGGLDLGSAVFALALPASGEGPRVTVGTVSSTGRVFRGPSGRLVPNALEHTAPLGRGSSGGPLLDREGRLAGVNTHRPGEGLYLALPVTESFKERVSALARGEAPARRRLGVGLAPSHVARRMRAAVGLPARDGVIVRDVAAGSPADSAGIALGDLIVAAAGEPVGSIDGLLFAVDSTPAGQPLRLTLVRGTEELEVQVRFDT